MSFPPPRALSLRNQYQRSVLDGAHIRYLTQVFTNVCGDLGATLAECTGEDDHVHL